MLSDNTTAPRASHVFSHRADVKQTQSRLQGSSIYSELNPACLFEVIMAPFCVWFVMIIVLMIAAVLINMLSLNFSLD